MTETIGLVLGVSLLAAAGVLVRHRFWPNEDCEPREDVAEYIAMMVGVLYALLLGLSLVSVWEGRSSAEEHVHEEASAAHEIYQLADSLPAADALRLRESVTQYVRHTVRVELPALAEGRPPPQEGWHLLRNVRTANQLPADAKAIQQATVGEVLTQLWLLNDARRGREADARDGLSPVLWFGLLTGGLLTIAFMFMFGIQRSATHVVMVMGLTGLITLTVLLIYQLDQPFTGPMAVDSSSFSLYFPGT
ncbi:hypothetical protein DMA15_02705 [Streptomyces sp. WAC 01529]|uniref:bestrophin-like domain n=1 Tax=Streptomyces sp. WAC 01529 TaxID=2203205 RepID=UPI000F6DE1D8|nr:DUF4239 domain-containing protein [Streptomyces sp. WAC 01529]AZM51629.1 hypothetical protein DMA15_02705 [Streptomyces sp. WAC 01529]